MRRVLVAAGVVSALLVGVLAWALMGRAAPTVVVPAVESEATPEERVRGIVAGLEPPTASTSERSAVTAADEVRAETKRPHATKPKAVEPKAHFVLRVIDDETGLGLPSSWALYGDTDLLSMESDDPRAEFIGSNSRDPSLKAAVADGTGYIDVEAGSRKRSLVRVEAPGHSWTAISFKEGHSTRPAAREVRLKRAAAVDVLVADPSGRAIEGALVELSTDAYRMMDASFFDGVHTSEPVRWSGSTDDQGRVLVPGLPPNVPLALSWEARGELGTRPPQTITLDAGEVRRLDLTVGGAVSLSGWLRTPTGKGVEYTEVWLKSAGGDSHACFNSRMKKDVQTTVTSATGEFTFEDVADGAWFVGCSPEEPYAAQVELVTVRGGAVDRSPTVIAESDGFIRGRVVSPAGEPRQAFVYADPKEGLCSASADTETDGSFSIGPLKAGSYVLGAMVTGSDRKQSLTSPLPVEVEAGTANVVLALRVGGTLSGRVVVGETGAGIKTVVQLQRAGDSEREFWRFQTATSEEGVFEFRGLEAWTYSVIASAPPGQVAWQSRLSMEEGGQVSGVVLMLGPAARLRVKYVGAGREGYVRVRLGGELVFVERIQNGTETTILVPPGRIELECEEWPLGTSSPIRKTVDALEGELTTVKFGPS